MADAPAFTAAAFVLGEPGNADVERPAREFAALVHKVEFRKDGEAVLKGSDVEVYRVAALLQGGMSADEVCADFPSLSPQHVADAKAYAEAHPKSGRPYPQTTFKRAMRGAGLQALDEVLDDRG